MVKFINITLAILATLFVAFFTGSILLGAVHFGFSALVVTALSVCFLVVTIGVGTVSIMEALELI